jgi:hypothetical protein
MPGRENLDRLQPTLPFDVAGEVLGVGEGLAGRAVDVDAVRDRGDGAILRLLPVRVGTPSLGGIAGRW